MEKFSFDFNAIQQPALEITLPDENQTKISVTTPKVSLIERLDSSMAELDEIFNTKDMQAIQQLYELLAEILNCNKEHKKFTAEELKEFLNFEHASAFLISYMSFITEVRKAKN